jgi:NAD(P)-dependent dehydrogenase (short-subunit alcohol dehydrogenase family)
MNQIDLQNRIAIVTGGARGIGRSIAERLLASGARVSLWDVDAAALAQASSEIGTPDTVHTATVDLADLASVQTATAATAAAFGKIDILVNNAGITGGNAKTWELDPADWRRVMEINLNGPFYCCHSVVPHLITNIFVNARGNSGGTGKHYAVVYGGSGGGSAVGLTAGGNLFLASGTAGVLGLYGNDVITLSTWQSATGQDATSAVADPIFVNPNGSASTVDLHIAANSPANNAALALAAVTADFDGQSRSATTPAIGADEFFQPDIAVTQTSAVADGGSIDFGSVTLGSSSNAKTFTIANPGTADLTSLAVTGGNSEFVVSALSASTVLVGTGTVTFTVTFTPSATGARSNMLQIGNNVTGAKNPFDINLTGTGLTEQESWRLTYFGSVANSGAGADAADFDKDGFSNLFEYVAGLVPTDPASIFKSRIEPVVGNATQMKIIFSPIVSGRTYTVKTSPGLGAAAVWTNLTGGLTNDNGNERTITDTNATVSAKFYRVEITKP